jgi:hypothetical protein
MKTAEGGVEIVSGLEEGEVVVIEGSDLFSQGISVRDDAFENPEPQRPMAIAVVGGMTVSTLLTLFVVPAAYSRIADLVSGEKEAPSCSRRHWSVNTGKSKGLGSDREFH